MTEIEIISFWKEFDTKSKPYWHPADKDIIESKKLEYYNINNYEELINHPEFGNIDGKFHLNLLPVPYTGNIINAKAYILLLNPGFSILDYNVENDNNIKQNIINNIKQDFSKTKYPFMWLNPEYIWTGGGQWIENKLRDIIYKVKESKKLSYVEALEYISNSIAIIELVPYHSKFFNLSSKTLNSLESVIRIKKFINDYVFKKVENEETCIIVTRKCKEWNLPSHKKDIIVYEGSKARGASLSSDSDGGAKILEYLLNH
jgi:hypothetical protein